MTSRGVSAAVAALALAACGAGPALAQPGASVPLGGRLLLDVNYLAQLHSELLLIAKQPEPLLLDEAAYRGSLTAYRQARELTREPRVWQFLYDVAIEASAPEQVRAAASKTPSEFIAAEKEAAGKVLNALADAWSRYEAGELNQRKRGHRVMVDGVLRRVFQAERQDRLLSVLYEKMDFKALEAPITIVLVARAPGVGTWGFTSRGYYLIIPMESYKGPAIIESIVHEATHLLDARQPAGSDSFLQKLRRKASKADPAALETLIHGLIAWNSGELVKRHIAESYRPMVVEQRAWRSLVNPYLPTFEGPWLGYLNGRLKAPDVVDAMAAVLKPASPAPRSGGG